MLWQAAALKKRVSFLESRCAELLTQRDKLEDQVHTAQSEYKKLKLTKKIEDEEIAHKLKMREEQVDLNYEKKAQENHATCEEKVRKIKSEHDDKLAKVKDEYRDKVEKNLEKRGEELRGMYSEILTRLPEVNVNLGDGGSVKQKKQK